MDQPEGHRISAVEPGSIAAELGLQAGDFLLQLDGHSLVDIFDYHMSQLKNPLVLTVRQQGTVIEFEIEKDEDEELGLSFANPMLQDCTECDNHCIFCFIDQLPPNLRSSLYFKDDDLRLSFLSGNYATLTNLSDEALQRLIRYRFSPMNISVHTTRPSLRQKMLRHRDSGRILQRLKQIAAAGLQVNCQIVLCPGINDGAELERTLSDLVALGPSVSSIALVPVGMTRYRLQNRLYPLQHYDAAGADVLLEQVGRWQHKMLAKRGTRLVFAADEFFLMAGRPFPEPSAYETFPQLENGVGMASAMLAELKQALSGDDIPEGQPVWQEYAPGASESGLSEPAVILVTGTAAAPLLEPFASKMAQRAGCPVQVHPVVNCFFGESVTVAGLITGQDILAQIKPCLDRWQANGKTPLLLMPSTMFKADEPIMLDDLTLQALSEQLSVPVWVSRPAGAALAGLLDRIRHRGGRPI